MSEGNTLSRISSQKQGSERVEMVRLYVDQKGEEYVTVPELLSWKIHDLLESQENMLSHDIEKMFETADEIQGANCHKTALYLTSKIPKKMLFDIRNDNPETAGHEVVEASTELFTELEEFKSAMRNKEFPFRISFFQQEGGKYVAKHSVTVLGITNKKRLVGFEKQGAHSDNAFRYLEPLKAVGGYVALGYTPGLEKPELGQV